MSNILPFTSIVGLELVKHSLLYHAIDPQLGGVLLMGHRGCAKSTIARAFGKILPASLNGRDSPFVEVPIGTSEDRLIGSIDPSSLLEKGKWKAQKGLIEKANGGVLYIDEVNLLPDHHVDSILDSAARGQYRVEREGLSKTVNARYILVGSMNPEEGDLRPQLNDRFTHGIFIKDDFSIEERREIVRIRMNFDEDPKKFLEEHQSKLEQLKSRIIRVRQELKNVDISESLRTEVANKAARLKLEGVRAELGVIRTARCSAAWRGDNSISDSDLEEAWVLCIGHRQSYEPTESQNTQQERNISRSQIEDMESRGMQISRTSLSPREASETEVPLKSLHQQAHSELALWWQSSSKKKPDNFVSGISRLSNTRAYHYRLCWVSSLIVSLVRGWTPGKELQLRFLKTARRPNIWMFFDASRSTGAFRSETSGLFLAATRNVVQTLGSKTFRCCFHVLVLQNGKINWWIKRGTTQAFIKSLGELRVASGKSPLISAINKLRNSIQKQAVLEGDRVLICSDGMLSPENEKTLPEIKKKFRNSLRNISKIISTIAWLHPQMRRGMRHWLPELVKGTSIRLIALD